VVTIAWLGTTEREPGVGHRRPGFAADGRGEDLERPGAGLGHVGVRVLLVADEGVHTRRHRVRQVGVEVERRHDRHRRSDHLADRLDQEAFAVVVVLQRHRAVEDEQDAVDRQRGPDPGHDLVAQRVERLAGDPAARHDRAVGRRDQLHAEPPGLGDGAAVDGAGAFEVEQVLTADDGAEARTQEIGERRRLPLEGVGLLGDAAGDDPHPGLLGESSRWTASGAGSRPPTSHRPLPRPATAWSRELAAYLPRSHGSVGLDECPEGVYSASRCIAITMHREDD
jgi:hypothetical protein